ncbi:hypothetical protein A5893_06150 [Pedobacter psychrophilus]|uniref:Uncharacterized protein n=1 Tax=Pedobacter psychrophilus TaxID=1826909 RepID=A0A179DHH7_9SPHI|nr:hypothetical protein [Pedobacter psychrophilus]OAQ40527.1 hypothetical protein A5893_06150 [Pedobacter psychrophilus]
MKNKNLLIENISKSNLSEDDKLTLINDLNKGNIEGFIITTIKVFGISKEFLNAFDIDIGHFIKDLF